MFDNSSRLQVVVMKLTNNRLSQIDGLTIPRNCSSVDARAELPIEDTIDVRCGEFRIVGKQVVNGQFDLSKTSGSILKLEQLLDAKELATFEDRLVFVVNNDLTIRSVRLADKDQADAELTFHVSCEFFLVGRQVAVLLQDGTKLPKTFVIRLVLFQCMLHDELGTDGSKLLTITVEVNNGLLVVILTFIAQTLHDGTKLSFRSIAVRKCVLGNVVDFRLMLLASVFLHNLQSHCS